MAFPPSKRAPKMQGVLVRCRKHDGVQRSRRRSEDDDDGSPFGVVSLLRINVSAM